MTSLPSLGPRGEGWVILQFLLLPLVALSGLVGGGAWSGPLATLGALVGLALMAAGALLVGRGLLDLGRNLTPVPDPRDDAQLVDSGAYGTVRHPIYGGIIATAFGWALASASPPALLLAATLALFFELKSRREEAWLSERYADYAAYRAQTRRFFPGLY
ncbi:MAG: isoprenylcysteine carboxylmethyltransferase family protein [Chloroflexota bacterium]|jgi:protein-S-isoprenylcysteine O-methyltransferase Ste14